MNVEQFRQIESLFEAASTLPKGERREYLDAHCDDDKVRIRVLGMLEHEDRQLVVPELESVTRHAPEGNSRKPLDQLIGSTIGPYRLVELIGEGGFGSVYMAEQREPVHRLVALKLIKLGMDTKQVIARFDAERQALAMMDHAGIARVLDAGATDAGRPYFVMELVRGVAITEYCDRNRLSIMDRLLLFMQVCDGVHHAHQKGVIHRDLKPSNVLVTMHDGKPLPKIIDFGISKATRGRLTDKTLYTEFRQFIGTPEYMSPEQAEMSGLDIDTRSDIYSLGVLLYELLTGVPPFDGDQADGDRDTLIRTIVDQEPRKPSTRLNSLGSAANEIARKRAMEPASLQRALKGDLDWIVLKAIAKDRARRYESAAEFAHEIERLLADRPISARPPGVGYLLRKFVRRHRVLVGAAAMVLLALVIGLIFAVFALAEANHQRDRAVDAQRQAEERLWESSLAQARAARSSDHVGRRFDALRALAQAADIRPATELRDEAVASLAWSDFEHEISVRGVPHASTVGLGRVDRYAYEESPGRVRIVSLTDGAQLAEITGRPYPPSYIRFSSNGRFVAVRFYDHPRVHLVVWDLQKSAAVLDMEFSSAIAQGIVFDEQRPTPDWVAVNTGSSTIEVFGLPSGASRSRIEVGHTIQSMAGHAAGAVVGISHFYEKKIAVWNLHEETQLQEISTEHTLRGIDFDRRGERVAGALSNGEIGVWDVRTGSLLVTASKHEGQPTHVRFGPDDGILVSYGWDNVTRFWDTATGNPAFAPMLNHELIGFGDRLAMKRGGSLGIWRFEAGDEFRELQSTVEPMMPNLDIGPRNRFLVRSGHETAEVWDLRSGKLALTLPDEHVLQPRFEAGSDSIIGATDTGIVRWTLRSSPGGHLEAVSEVLNEVPGIIGFGLEGRTIAVAQADGIDIFDLESMRRINGVPADRGQSSWAQIRYVDHWLFTEAWRATTARVWDTRSGTPVLEIQAPHVEGRFSEDARWFIASTGSEFRQYDIRTWQLVHTYPRDNTDDLAGPVAISGEAGIAALAHSRYDIRLVDLKSGETLATLRAPNAAVIRDIALSEDGDLLIASTALNTLQIWNLRTMRQGLRALDLDWTVER